MNVLVVEDSHPVSILISHMIAKMGHIAIPAGSGEEALEIFHQTPIDLVLMDVEMPGMNGFETTRAIRESLKDNWIPIIFLSANAEESHLAAGINAGGDDYLIKPIKSIVLEAKIKAMARIATMRGELNKANKELAAANEELYRLSFIDGLTAVTNRRGFDQAYHHEWKRHERQNDGTLSVLLIDIDHFKAYNDHYGHLKGDDCLKRVASCLAGNFKRPTDILCRYGGEEFVALMPNTGLDGAVGVANRLVKAIQSLNIKHEKSSASPFLSISAGVASSDMSKHFQPESFLEAVDKALYQAKTQGRNQYQIYLPARNHRIAQI